MSVLLHTSSNQPQQPTNIFIIMYWLMVVVQNPSHKNNRATQTHSINGWMS
jgi:hypothetical protein